MKDTEYNGLIGYFEEEIFYREHLIKFISQKLKLKLEQINRAFVMMRCETPCLVNSAYIDSEYFKNSGYIFNVDNEPLALRPETTAGIYKMAKYIMNPHHYISYKPPFCLWQVGKSFRNEQDKTYKHIRLKEFYQLEFEIFYTKDTKADYPKLLYPVVKDILENELYTVMKLEESDRLPRYSTKTMDIIVDDNNNMELCSMSSRTDFDDDLKVFEISIGLDRIIYIKNLLYDKED